MLRYVSSGIGCQTCSYTNYINVFVAEERLLCLPSNYSKWNSLITATTLIPHCKEYSYELTNTIQADFAIFQSAKKCLKCNQGYLETSDHSSCKAITSALHHCLLINSANNQCMLCSQNYYPGSGECEPNGIEFCQTAEYSSSNSRAECLVCDEGYYYNPAESITACLPGRVNQCKLYNGTDGDYCSECIEGFFALSVNSGKKRCVKISHTNCLSIKTGSAELAGNLFDCEKCQNGYFISESFNLDNNK